LNRIMLVVNGRGGTGQIINLIRLDIERKCYVVSDYLKTMMIKHRLDVSPRSGEIIIDANDIGALVEQLLTQMGTEKSGSSRNQRARFKMQLRIPLV
jgi:hypothetical protein